MEYTVGMEVINSQEQLREPFADPLQARLSHQNERDGQTGFSRNHLLREEHAPGLLYFA